MEKILLRLKVVPERMYEVTSEAKLPEWFAKRAVLETFSRSSLNNQEPIRIGDLVVKYTESLPLVKIFVCNTQKIGVTEGSFKFSDYLRESEITPYNVKALISVTGKDPEVVFSDLSSKVERLAEELSSLYGSKLELHPDISYEGDLYTIKFSIPLDPKGTSILKKWSDDNGLNAESEVAPLEEKRIKLRN